MLVDHLLKTELTGLVGGLGPLTMVFGCATLVVVASQAAGMDFLVAGHAWLQDTAGRQVL